MNGIHDMGGMDGLGPILREANEPVFHEAWEARMFGLAQASTHPAGYTVDLFRYLGEQMPAAAYLAQSYYERWYFLTALALLQGGMVTLPELSSGRAAPGSARRADAMRAESVPSAIGGGADSTRESKAPPRFAPGQAVLARNIHPAGHTRLPRYVRGRRGVILRRHGAHVFPDSRARGDGDNPQQLYTVAFAARELWGPDAAAGDKIHLDLWESYLEPA
jgi:nitrile hydratase subunit beta